MSSDSRASISGAVFIAALISLVVTLVRLLGEQQKWAPALFGTSSGGGGAILGITWLVLPFGFWFGRRLAQNGHRPASTGKSLLLPLLGFGLAIGVGMTVFNLDLSWHTRAWCMNIGTALAGLLAFVAWRRCWFVCAFYGVLARVPVIVVQYVSLEKGWDNHFAKGPPGSDPADLLFLLTLAQAVFWPFAFTTLVGGFFAALGALTVKKQA
ncbi:MAG: hypothetical protein WAT39_19225 [Planctomycetota bacterium]